MRRLLALLVCLAFVALTGCGGSSTPPAIFLGHVANLSGPEGRTGRSAEQGMRLALEDLGPAASEALTGRPIAVRHVDSGGDLDNVEAEAARLVSVNHVWGLFGGLTKDEALRLDRSRVPVLSPLSVRTPGMSELLFTTGVTPKAQADALADHLAEAAPKVGVLIVDPRREDAVAMTDLFRRAWHDVCQKKNPKTEPPRWREFQFPKDGDLAEWAGLIAKEKPQAVVFAGSGSDLEKLRIAWGDSTPLIAYLCDDGGVGSASVVEGQTLLVATAFALDKDSSKANEFAKKYRDAHGEDPDVHAAIAYDNLRLYVEAMKKVAAQPSTEKMREELLKIQDFPGLTGPLSFTREQHLRRPVFVARVSGPGRAPTLVKTYNP